MQREQRARLLRLLELRQADLEAQEIAAAWIARSSRIPTAPPMTAHELAGLEERRLWGVMPWLRARDAARALLLRKLMDRMWGVAAQPDPAFDAILGDGDWLSLDEPLPFDEQLEQGDLFVFDSDVGGELGPDDVVGTNKLTGAKLTRAELERDWQAAFDGGLPPSLRPDPWELKQRRERLRWLQRHALEQLEPGELEHAGPGGRALRRERRRRARKPLVRLLFLRWAWLAAEPQHRRGMVAGSAVQAAQLEREAARLAMDRLRIAEARRHRDRVEWWQWLAESVRGFCESCLYGNDDPDDAPHWRVKGHGANRE